jgi:hypothetical protein
MQGTDLSEAQMPGAVLWEAQMQGADLWKAQMQGAFLWEAQMQGADLSEAQMQGALLFGARMSEDTNTTDATLRGAALVFVDGTTIARLQPHWDDIIAALETLPEGAPRHWVQADPGGHNYGAFVARWRAFAAGFDPPVTIALDYHPAPVTIALHPAPVTIALDDHPD